MPIRPVIQLDLTEPRYSIQDLILAPETMDELKTIVSFFKNKNKLFGEWGFDERYADRDGLAVNLYGESGTGKTMAAHAVAKELGLKMICVDYADIESKYVGETAKNLKALFQKATDEGAIIFFDEADALLSKRVTNMTLAADVSVNQTRSVLLTLLNDYQGVILFATNFIQNFYSAFLRRIRWHIKFSMPDADLREKLWRLYIPSKMPVKINYAEIAEKFDNISGADISNAVFAAAVAALTEDAKFVEQERFERAVVNIINAKKANQSKNFYTESKRVISEAEANTELESQKSDAKL